MKILFSSLMLLATLTVSCASGGSASMEKEGSSPLNGKESIAYQKALLRCYKQGGTRIVKIQNELRCF